MLTARYYNSTQFEMIPNFSILFAQRFLNYGYWYSERFIHVPNPPTNEGRDLPDNLTETGSLINGELAKGRPTEGKGK